MFPAHAECCVGRTVLWPPVSSAAGDVGEELHAEPFEERLAERSIQPCELSRGAERQEDDAAGRWDVGRDPAGRVGQMNCHDIIWSTSDWFFNIFYICVLF